MHISSMSSFMHRRNISLHLCQMNQSTKNSNETLVNTKAKFYLFYHNYPLVYEY